MDFYFLASVQRRLLRIGREFRILWKNYFYQSFLATAVVLIVLLLLSAEHAVVIASIGATAFIVFTMPRNVTAKPRRVIGGHLIGLFSGSLCSLIPRSRNCHHRFFSQRDDCCPDQQHSTIAGSPLLQEILERPALNKGISLKNFY